MSQHTPIKDETELKKIVVINQRAYEIPADVAFAYDDLIKTLEEIAKTYKIAKDNDWKFDFDDIAYDKIINSLEKAGVKV